LGGEKSLMVSKDENRLLCNAKLIGEKAHTPNFFFVKEDPGNS